MGHRITGLVGKRAALARIAAALGLAAPAALRRGLAFLPLDDDDIDGIVGHDPGPALTGFAYLTGRVAARVAALSRGTALAYVETDHGGGAGGQGAALFRDGAAATAPAWSPGRGQVNRALAALGVEPGPGERDEFEAAGLGRFRSNDRWREAAAGAEEDD